MHGRSEERRGEERRREKERQNKKEKRGEERRGEKKERDTDRVREKRHFVNAFNEEQVILSKVQVSASEVKRMRVLCHYSLSLTHCLTLSPGNCKSCRCKGHNWTAQRPVERGEEERGRESLKGRCTREVLVALSMIREMMCLAIEINLLPVCTPAKNRVDQGRMDEWMLLPGSPGIMRVK